MGDIVITGHKGFVGKNLFKQFTSVIGIDEKYDESYINNFLNIHQPDVVFHIGACSDTLNTDVSYVLELNYLKTKWISDWCYTNNVKLIYASSAAIYGTDKTIPFNLYGWSKLLGEDYVINKGGVALRYFNVYGPGEEHKGKMASMIYQNIQKDKVKLFPNKPTRDFVYIDDVVDANMYALLNYDRLKGRWYEVGIGESNTFERIFDLIGTPYEYLSEDNIPNGYQTNTLSLKENWMPGWKPKVSLEMGIEKYKKYLNEKS
jgi:ADP-L-glycero-D-manno-heptose 6-epimerase